MTCSLNSVAPRGKTLLRLQRYARAVRRDDILHRPREPAGLAPVATAFGFDDAPGHQRVLVDDRDAIDHNGHEHAKAQVITGPEIERADRVGCFNVDGRARG